MLMILLLIYGLFHGKFQSIYSSNLQNGFKILEMIFPFSYFDFFYILFTRMDSLNLLNSGNLPVEIFWLSFLSIHLLLSEFFFQQFLFSYTRIRKKGIEEEDGNEKSSMMNMNKNKGKRTNISSNYHK